MLLNALTWVRSVLITIPLIIISTVGMATAALAGVVAGRHGEFQVRCMRLWARMVLASSLVRVTATGLEKIEPSRSYVFCVNHLSYMDVPVILACLRTRARFLAKRSLFSIPFFGWALRWTGHLSIERENPRAAGRSLVNAVGTLRGGTSVIVFPEGGRSLDGTLQPFLGGGFRVAIDAQVPVVPLAIVGTREVLAPGSIHIHGGRVRLVVGTPIPTAGMAVTDRDALTEQVRKIIEELLSR